jgi:hypothetical protein
MALVSFGGNKIALSTITRIVKLSTTNTRTAGLSEIEPYPPLELPPSGRLPAQRR